VTKITLFITKNLGPEKNFGQEIFFGGGDSLFSKKCKFSKIFFSFFYPHH
jgi:hypothetical protein